ncbi:hypothetical protein GA0115259_100433 [Streptomyces sp. MnatMP-M17]|nr:hypothetical protein GA0115259_100433 [Streptomyces sp. MnatMP-M17]
MRPIREFPWVSFVLGVAALSLWVVALASTGGL